MEEWFRNLAGQMALGVEIAAVVIVVFGAADAFLRLVGIVLRGRATHGERKVVWRRFGTWLLLALEFELGADIVRSAIAPTWLDIGQLGAIAVIRTFLNYFLEKDLENAIEESSSLSGPRAA